MSNEYEQHLSVGEFQRSMTALEGNVLARFDQRFDRIESKIDSHAERITILETNAKKGKVKAASWASAISTVVVAGIEALRTYFSR